MCKHNFAIVQYGMYVNGNTLLGTLFAMPYRWVLWSNLYQKCTCDVNSDTLR